jgi:hypothetical protein
MRGRVQRAARAWWRRSVTKIATVVAGDEPCEEGRRVGSRSSLRPRLRPENAGLRAIAAPVRGARMRADRATEPARPERTRAKGGAGGAEVAAMKEGAAARSVKPVVR